jgi:integrase
VSSSILLFLSFQANRIGEANPPFLEKEWRLCRERHKRHAYGIKLAELGCEMHFISEVMGHHSIDFTRRMYARFSPQSASRAVLRVLQGGKNGTNLAHGIA